MSAPVPSRSPKSRYLLALVSGAAGSLTPVHGRLEIQGGKVIGGEIRAEDLPMWQELIETARVELGALAGVLQDGKVPCGTKLVVRRANAGGAE